MGFNHREVFDYIVAPNSLDFSVDKARGYFMPKLESIASSGKIPVLSSEMLCGSPFTGGRESKENADRIAKLFPSAKILIVIREQVSAICSTYKQYVQTGGPGSLHQFLFPPFPSFSIPRFDPIHFQYHRLIKYYISLFGLSNVKVMLYESFSAEKEAFCNEILSFVGLTTSSVQHYSNKRIYASLSDRAISIKRVLNRFSRTRTYAWPIVDIPYLHRLAIKLLGGFDSVVSSKSPQNQIYKQVKRYCQGQFMESNRVLESLLEVDLKDFGYE